MTLTETESIIKPGEFYKIRPDGKWEIYLDATMCSTFGACPQMFYYSFVRSLIPKGGDKVFSRDLGSWWSKLMELIYTAEFQNKRMEPMQVLAAATKIWDELKMDELEKFHPRSYKEFGGRYGALQMIADYANTQLPIDYHTWKIIAAEASFGRNKEVCIGETEKIILYWMGQPDLYVISSGRVHPVDHKSIGWIDANLAAKYKPNIQIPGYIVAGQILAKSLGYDLPIDRAIINCVARTDRTDKTDTGKYPRFRRIPVSYTANELEEWKVRRLKQSERLRTCFETNHWDWNEQTCSYFFMKPCPFRNVDNKPPETRELVIFSDYITRPHWIPGRTEKEKEKEGDNE